MSRFHRLFILPALLLPVAGSAAVLTVGPVSCAYTSLGSAVAAANAGDEIRIHKDYAEPTNVLIQKSLTLVGGLPHCFAATPETSTSVSTLTSSGTPSRQVLDIRGAGVEVTLYHLHLTGGLNVGGLNVQDGALVRAGGVEIDGNSALFGGGAWIHSTGSELRAVATPFFSALPALSIHDNQGGQGGGLYVANGALLRRETGAQTIQIGNNSTLNLGGSTGRGGGIYVQTGGHASGISFLDGNTALLGGGAFIEGRSAGTPVVDDVDLEVTGSLHLNNAGSGGGVYVATSDEAMLLLDRLFQNHAGNEGGGLWFGSNGSADIGVIEDNSSSGVGGGIHQSAGNLRIRLQLIDNTASSHGGGIYASGGTRSFDGGIEIARNASTNGDGGALWAELDGGTSIPGIGSCDVATPCRISQNTANGNGGAFHLLTSDLRIYSSGSDAAAGLQVSNNISGDFGGAIYAGAGSAVHVIGDIGAAPHDVSRWTGNGASGGGGALALSNSDLIAAGAQFGTGGAMEGNSAPFGGALYIAGTGSSGLGVELSGRNLRFIGNSASANGGAIYATGNARVDLGVVKCTSSTLPANRYCSEISGNQAALGSAIYTLGAEINLSSVAVIGNLGTDTSSSALHLNGNGGNNLLENVLLSGNDDHAIRIDDVLVSGTPVQLDSCTLVDHPGAAIMLADEAGIDLSLANSLIWNNGFASIDGLSGSASAAQSCSLIGGGQLGALSSNPKLISNPRGDNRLDSGSPAIDACDNGVSMDLDGNTRDALPDIGAFEFDGALPPVIFSDGFETVIQRAPIPFPGF